MTPQQLKVYIAKAVKTQVQKELGKPEIRKQLDVATASHRLGTCHRQLQALVLAEEVLRLRQTVKALSQELQR